MWWSQWRRVAAAASVAAMLAAGALLWQAGGGRAELALSARTTAPESVALARVVAAYPDEAVLASLIETARTDEFTTWGTR